MRRQKYYSTKIKKKEKLRELVASKKLKDFEIRCGKEDYEWSKKTKKEMMIMFTLR
jgi:hypothetical protein